MREGMTIMGGAGVAIIEGGMETDERERARRPKRRGAQRPASLFPRGHVIPAKREPTGGALTAVPSPAAFAASSPLIGRGGHWR